jgi:hypothetical protein
MFELFQSILIVVLITVNCYFPEKYYSYLTASNNSKHSLISQLSLGIIVHIFSLLILSFLTLLSEKIIFFYFIILFVHNLFFIIKEKIKNFKFELETFFLFFVIFIITIYFFNNFKIGWDAQNYWVTKALTIYNDSSIVNLKYTTRPEYPHLGSFIWSFYIELSFIKNEIFGRIFYIYFFCLCLISISKILSKNKLQNLIFYSFLILICFKNSLFNGYQEVLIFSLFVFITKEFYLYFNNKSQNDLSGLLIIIFSCFSMSWIKSEGMIFALLFLLTLFFYFSSHKKKQLLLALSAIAIILSKYLYLQFIDINSSFQSGNYELFSLVNLAEYITFDRFFMIIKYFIFGIFQNIALLASILTLPFLIKNKKDFIFLKYHFLFFLLCFLFIFSAYIFTNIPLEFHLKNSIDRLFFQISGFFIIFLFMIYNKLKNRIS